MNTIQQQAKTKTEGADLQEHILRVARMLRRHPAGEQVSRGRLRLIRVILAEEGIKTADLAQRLDIRPSSLTDLLKRMEENGEVLRLRDEQDARISRVYLTEKAKADFARRQAERQRQAARLATCLDEAERAAFCATCDKLCAFLEAEPSEASAPAEEGGAL